MYIVYVYVHAVYAYIDAQVLSANGRRPVDLETFIVGCIKLKGHLIYIYRERLCVYIHIYIYIYVYIY